MSKIVTVFDVRLVDAYLLRNDCVEYINELYDAMMAAEDKYLVRYYYGLLRRVVSDLNHVHLLSDKRKSEIERRIRDAYKCKVCTY